MPPGITVPLVSISPNRTSIVFHFWVLVIRVINISVMVISLPLVIIIFVIVISLPVISPSGSVLF